LAKPLESPKAYGASAAGTSSAVVDRPAL